jgi:hypothetical protein
MDDLNAGTKEIVSINIEDRLDTITDLSSNTVDYKVEKDDGTDQVSWALVTEVVLMRVDVLLDTTGWDTGHYELFIRPTIGSEQPILGPFDFDLV